MGPGTIKDTSRYRTTGLRFLVRSGRRMFLLHDGWTPQRGTVIVVRRHNGVFQSSTTILKDAPVAPSNVGQASMPDYAKLRGQAVRSLPDGGKVFAARACRPRGTSPRRTAPWHGS